MNNPIRIIIIPFIWIPTILDLYTSIDASNSSIAVKSLPNSTYYV